MKPATKLWFKNKRYGYGWYPSSWEGWLVLGVYIVILVYLVATLLPETKSHTDKTHVPASVWWYLLKIFVLTTILLIIARVKGEKPQWRWGDKKIDSKSDKK